MALTDEDVVSILKIIDQSPNCDVRVEIGDLKVYVSRRSAGATGSDERDLGQACPPRQSPGDPASQ